MQIKSYFNYNEEHKALYRAVLRMTKPVGAVYPDYEYWYKKTFLPGLKKGERVYVIAKDATGKLAGCALLKDTPEEKKISTLFVRADWRGHGVGTELMKASLKILGAHPLLTISNQNLPQFKPLLARFGFRLSAKKKIGTRTEYHFNDEQADVIKDGLIPVLIQRMKQLRHK